MPARERRRYAQSRAPLVADRRTTSAEQSSSVPIHDGRAHSLSIGGNRAAITRRHGNARSLPWFVCSRRLATHRLLPSCIPRSFSKIPQDRFLTPVPFLTLRLRNCSLLRNLLDAKWEAAGLIRMICRIHSNNNVAYQFTARMLIPSPLV